MITREFNLYLHAGHSIPLVINANQYDHGEQWLFTLFNSDGTQYVPSSGAIVGIKSDNLGIINSGSVDSNGKVVINETQQMTAAVGKAVFELVIDDGTHGTANFVVLVEAKPGDQADLSETDISMIEQAIEAAANIKPYGSPLVASTVAGMTDHDKVYVYVGSETGYTSGHWYYYDGDSWEDGGVYNSVAVQTDTTLTLSGVAADAKKTGDEISDLKSQIDQIEEQIEGGTSSGLTADIKTALLAMFEHIGYEGVEGRQKYNDLYNALYAISAVVLNTNSIAMQSIGSTMQLTASTVPVGGNVSWESSDTSVATVDSTGLVTSTGWGTATITASAGNQSATCSVSVAQVTLSSLSAVYTQSGTVYEGASLQTLKEDLVVTAHWSDNTTSTVLDGYTLSGNLTEGNSTVTVTYQSQTTSFVVNVSALVFNTSAYITVANANLNEGYINDSGEVVSAANNYYIDTLYPLMSYVTSRNGTVQSQEAGKRIAFYNSTTFGSRTFIENKQYWSANDAPSNITNMKIGYMVNSSAPTHLWLAKDTDGSEFTLTGKEVGSDGALTDNQYRVATDLIPITEGDKFVLLHNENGERRIAFYDSSQSFISLESVSGTGKAIVGDIPTGASYYRISKPTNGISNNPIAVGI